VKARIRMMEDYSGHADGPELVSWVKQRLPIGRTVFLTHGEDEGQIALENDLKGIGVPGDCILRPRLDDVYDLSGEACALLAEETKPRIDPAVVGTRDAHNDLTDILLEIRQEIDRTSDEKSRGILIRKLRRALAGEGSNDSSRRRPPVSGPSRRNRGYDEG
jgi:metallo-beta-lactamase family protein